MFNTGSIFTDPSTSRTTHQALLGSVAYVVGVVLVAVSITAVLIVPLFVVLYEPNSLNEFFEHLLDWQGTLIVLFQTLFIGISTIIFVFFISKQIGFNPDS